MKLLVTAFDPFGGEQVNAAWEAVSRLPDRIGNVELTKLTVPTEFRRSAAVVTAAVDALLPDAVLCVGQAAGRAGLTPERVAINVCDASIPDNAGFRPEDEPIEADGPAAYFSTLPIRAMTEAVRAAGLPASISNTAGTYVCNRLMYGLLHHLARNHPAVRGGFLHVPLTRAQAESRRLAHPDESLLPSLSPAELTRGLAAAISALEAS